VRDDGDITYRLVHWNDVSFMGFRLFEAVRSTWSSAERADGAEGREPLGEDDSSIRRIMRQFSL
jgi:hypothetical protein